jgi:hypothetical protein
LLDKVYQGFLRHLRKLYFVYHTMNITTFFLMSLSDFYFGVSAPQLIEQLRGTGRLHQKALILGTKYRHDE